MLCIRCECKITEKNPLMESTGTCLICRDEEFNLAAGNNDLSIYADLIIWMEKLNILVKELDEPPIDSDENNENLREF